MFRGVFKPNFLQPTHFYDVQLDESHSAVCTMQRASGPLLIFFLQPADTQQHFLIFSRESLVKNMWAVDILCGVYKGQDF